MEIKEQIEHYFNHHPKIQTFRDLVKTFKIEEEELSSVLYELECSGKIMGFANGEYIHVPEDFYLYFGKVCLSSKGNFYLPLKQGSKAIIEGKYIKRKVKEGDYVFVELKPDKKHKLLYKAELRRVVKPFKNPQSHYLAKGILRWNAKEHFYYVLYENKKVYIQGKNKCYAFPGDEVTFRFSTPYTGELVEVIKRNRKEHLFETKREKNILIWEPICTLPFFIPVEIPCEEGDQVKLQIEKNAFQFLERIKRDQKTKSWIESIALEQGIDSSFSKKVMNEVSEIKEEIPKEEWEKRVNLCDLLTVTIDPETAKDMDDAISLEKLKDRYRLYVSIADVSHYVKPSMALFKSALEKGTSHYPANLVFSMLPPKLSEHICSLNEGVPRLAKTCIIDISFEGNILNYQFVRSIIKSDKKMQYKKVNELLTGENIEKMYLPFYHFLKEANFLASLLQKRRMERGFICFDVEEIDFLYNEYNEVVGINRKDRGLSQMMIENFMLLANECAGNFAYYLGIPFVFRNNEVPEMKQLSRVQKKLENVNVYIKKLNQMRNAQVFQKILLSLCNEKSKEEVHFISNILLSGMKRAEYSIHSLGHFGLALDHYATITSPIRRFPDLLNQLAIDAILDGKIEEFNDLLDDYAAYAYTSTMKQMESEAFENLVTQLLLHKVADAYIGESLHGTVLFMTKNRLYLHTKENFYGYIELKEDQIREDIARIEGKDYKVGSSIEVKIKSISKKENEIEFSHVTSFSNHKNYQKTKH